MKKLSLIALTTSVVVSSFAFLAASASAIPVFARKYNVQCNMCHTVPPRLNKMGVAFKENGFELPPGTTLPESEVYGNQVLSTEEPKAIVGAGFPFMIRTGITIDVATSNNPAAIGALASNRPFGITVGEFGMIGGGSMETPLGGLGFWIDAPFAGAATGIAYAPAGIGAIDVDLNVNPLFKISFGNDVPKIGYALGLTPLYIGAGTRNPATDTANAGVVAALAAPASFRWGNSTAPGVAVRGTTKPETGLGFNYIVGYLTGGAAPQTTGVSDGNTVYAHASYYFDAINANFGVGTATESVAGAVSTDTNATSTLVDFAYGIGDEFMTTITYNNLTPSVGAGLVANSTSIISIQPEFAINPTISVGGRYVIASTPNVLNSAQTILSVGVNYKMLQNMMLWANYTSANGTTTAGINIAGGAIGTSGSSLQVGLDFIY